MGHFGNARSKQETVVEAHTVGSLRTVADGSVAFIHVKEQHLLIVPVDWYGPGPEQRTARLPDGQQTGNARGLVPPRSLVLCARVQFIDSTDGRGTRTQHDVHRQD